MYQIKHFFQNGGGGDRHRHNKINYYQVSYEIWNLKQVYDRFSICTKHFHSVNISCFPRNIKKTYYNMYSESYDNQIVHKFNINKIKHVGLHNCSTDIVHNQ